MIKIVKKESFNPVILLCAAIVLFAEVTTMGGELGKEVRTSVAESAVEPAVSSINGKIDTNYGAVNGSYTRGVSGSLSIPIDHSYGFQLDSLFEHGMESDIYGVGGHLFTRRPDKGLLGFAFADTVSTDYSDLIAGVEGEYYLDKVTLGAFVGYNNYDTHIIPTFDVDLDKKTDYVAGRLYAAIYPTDNVMLRLEYQNRFEHSFYIAHLEYQTPVRGLALFVDGGIGDHDYSHFVGGVRLYVGGDKSLKDRHRKDDPSNINSVFLNTGMAGSSNPGQPVNPGPVGNPAPPVNNQAPPSPPPSDEPPMEEPPMEQPPMET